MIILILGLLLWTSVHFWKRAAPDHRMGFGEKGKGIVAIGSFVAIALMVIGYRLSEGTVYWARSPAMTGINNLLMVFAIYLFAASGAKIRITRYIPHPQLTAVVVWAIAHLLVNGDTPSFVLFGGLAVWAIAEIVVLSRVQATFDPEHGWPVKKEITAIVATIVVTAVIAAIHTWLGYNPFG